MFLNEALLRFVSLLSCSLRTGPRTTTLRLHPRMRPIRHKDKRKRQPARCSGNGPRISCIVVNCFFLAFLVLFNLEHEIVFTDDHTRIKKVDIEFLGCCDILFAGPLYVFVCQVRVSAFLPSYYR